MPDMRFAPPNPLRIADRASGLNSGAVRSYNERLLLSLLSQSGSITRLEIGERTGLSAQTISVLIRSLEHEGLVSRGEAQKGRVGPPTVPVALNPDGAFSIGISIGHDTAQLALIDFLGAVRFSATLPIPKPPLASNHGPLLELIQDAVRMVPDEFRDRLAGVGFALPHMEGAAAAKEQFAEVLQREIEDQLGFPVFVQNDVTAAASGEVMFGAAKTLTNYLFAYIGRRLHGRLVLNHQIYHGNSPVSFDVGLDHLAHLLGQAGEDLGFLAAEAGDWPLGSATFTRWRDDLVAKLEPHFTTLSAFVELEAVVLSAPLPADVIDEICNALRARLSSTKIIAGVASSSPKAVGAAGLLFAARFMVT